MYNTREIENNITFDKIISLVNDYYIYCYYLGKTIKINKPISSPLRKDNHPSWSLYRNKKGILIYKDFATGESGNVINLVQKLYELKYHEALKRVWKDIIIHKNSVVPKDSCNNIDLLHTSKNIIEVKRKNFTDNDIQFWSKYSISKDTLKLYKVFPIHTFWINSKQYYTYTEKEPMYAYSIYNKFKIYRPYSRKQDKWRNNCTSYDIQGLEQLGSGKLLIITKSLKDVMVLHELGYHAIAPQSELSSIPKIIVDHLKLRFKNIVIMYDYDEGGIQGSKKLSEKYTIPSIFIPKYYLDLYHIKDISDLTKEFGKKKAVEVLKELLNEHSKK